MTTLKTILFISLILMAELNYAQQLERLDTTISIFWNPDLKIRVHILNPDEPDIRRNNAVLTLFSLVHNTQTIIFRDSIFAYTILFKMIDMDGDGLRDLLIYNANNGPENLSYHLYLVNQKLGRLTRVKGFERIYNPYFDIRHCNILGYESFEKKLILGWYQVDRKGNLGIILN